VVALPQSYQVLKGYVLLLLKMDSFVKVYLTLLFLLYSIVL
jgi:hypothetical protein